LRYQISHEISDKILRVKLCEYVEHSCKIFSPARACEPDFLVKNFFLAKKCTKSADPADPKKYFRRDF